MIRFLFLILSMAIGSGVWAQALSGTYTIGGSTPHYPSLTAAVSDLHAKGISGPVVFDIQPGTYTERIVLRRVSGTSSANTIIFKGAGKSATTITNTATAAATAQTVIAGQRGIYHLP